MSQREAGNVDIKGFLPPQLHPAYNQLIVAGLEVGGKKYSYYPEKQYNK